MTIEEIDEKKIELLGTVKARRNREFIIERINSDEKREELLGILEEESKNEHTRRGYITPINIKEKKKVYENLSDDEKMELLNKYIEEERDYYGAAEIIASMSSDDKKMELIEKQAYGLYDGQQDGIDYRTIIAEGIKSDEKKLELLEKHREKGEEYWYLDRIIASLQSDDKKLELGGGSPVVIASLSTDDKKIEQFAEHWQHMTDGDRSIVVTSLHSDRAKLKLLKIIEKEWNRAWVVETIISDEKKLELLEEFTNEDDRAEIIAYLGSSIHEISDIETESEISEHTAALIDSIVQGYFERKESFKEDEESLAYTLGDEAIETYREERKSFEKRFSVELMEKENNRVLSSTQSETVKKQQEEQIKKEQEESQTQENPKEKTTAKKTKAERANSDDVKKALLKKLGYNEDGYTDRGFGIDEIHRTTGTIYDEDGYDIFGYNKNGYDKEGYYRDGYNDEGISKETGTIYDANGFDREGIHRDTGSKFNQIGYDCDGFNHIGLNARHFDRNGRWSWGKTYSTRYSEDGRDMNGYDRAGYNEQGYNRLGYDRQGLDRDGLDIFGRTKEEATSRAYITVRKWIILDDLRINPITKTIYDEEGYDYFGFNREGFDRNGFNKDGYNRDGYNKEGLNSEGLNPQGVTIQQQEEIDIKDSEAKRRNRYFGLMKSAEKLAKGQVSLEEYMMSSRTNIEKLIEFAERNGMDKHLVWKLHKYIKPYKAMSKPFYKESYLQETIIVIDGKEVRPTEQDVDKCIEYMKANGRLICDKVVREVVRGYLRGEIDITERPDASDNKDAIVQGILKQQETIKQQEAEIANLKSQRRDTNDK